MTRAEAWTLLCQHTDSQSQRRHALAVEAAMAFYARRLGADEETWRVVGLLHDFDYERWPEPPDHTRRGAEILRARGVDGEIVGAVLSHADWNLEEYPRDRPLRLALFAVDEMSGFLTACALVRPGRLEGLGASSVRKKMKSAISYRGRGYAASRAAAVSREDLVAGAASLGLSLDEHIENCVEALKPVARDLGLEP